MNRPIINSALNTFGSNNSLDNINQLYDRVDLGYIDDATMLFEEWESNGKLHELIERVDDQGETVTHCYMIKECNCTLYLQVDDKQVNIVDIHTNGLSIAA